jgi:hypothetical protein
MPKVYAQPGPVAVLFLCFVTPVLFFLTPVLATGQTAAPAATALKPYTAPDQSASAGVPSGWQVTGGSQTVIKMTGPQGENAVLGETIIAKNAAFQLGQKPANGVDFSMPYSATLAQKFTMAFQQAYAAAGQTLNQFAIVSSTPLQLPATLGQCSRFVAGYSGQTGPMKVLAVFCSLPLDSAGIYKNILLEGEAPAASAAQAAPVVQSIFQSYRIPTAWLQKKLAPFTAAPAASAANSAAAAAAINRSTLIGIQGADTSANCFDLSVLRQTPTYNLPRSCGGTKPD